MTSHGPSLLKYRRLRHHESESVFFFLNFFFPRIHIYLSYRFFSRARVYWSACARALARAHTHALRYSCGHPIGAGSTKNSHFLRVGSRRRRRKSEQHININPPPTVLWNNNNYTRWWQRVLSNVTIVIMIMIMIMIIINTTE